MMEMKEQTGSRKKYLAPVVVLMLCLVTLTGAAYAYSSSMTYTANSIDSDAISIDLKGGTPVTTGANANIISESGAVVFEDHFVYSAPPVVKTNTVKAEVKDMLVLTYKLTVSGDAKANKVTVSSSTIDTYLANVIGNDGTNDVKISDLFSVKVSDSDDISGISGFTVLADDDDVAEFTISKTGADPVDKIIYIYIDTSLAAAKVVNPSTESTAGAAYKVASDFVTAFNALTFNLTFEATYVAP